MAISVLLWWRTKLNSVVGASLASLAVHGLLSRASELVPTKQYKKPGPILQSRVSRCFPFETHKAKKHRSIQTSAKSSHTMTLIGIPALKPSKAKKLSESSYRLSAFLQSDPTVTERLMNNPDLDGILGRIDNLQTEVNALARSSQRSPSPRSGSANSR